MELIAIAACGLRGEMGIKNRLPWNHPEDLKFFKKMTKDSIMIMGRKTFDSLPGLLPHRAHWVLSRQPSSCVEGVSFFSWEHIWHEIDKARATTQSQFCIIGGAEIYKLFAPFCTEIWMTHYQATFDNADCFFPLEVLDNRPILSRSDCDWASLKNYKAEIICYGAQEDRNPIHNLKAS